MVWFFNDYSILAKIKKIFEEETEVKVAQRLRQVVLIFLTANVVSSSSLVESVDVREREAK